MTTKTSKLGNFTVTSEARKWAVVRPPTKKETVALVGMFHIKKMMAGQQDLRTVDDVAAVLDRAIGGTDIEHRSRIAVIREFAFRGLVVLPYGPVANRFRRFRDADYLCAGASTILRTFKPCTSVPIGRHARNSLISLLLCTVEGRSLKPGRSTVSQWVVAMLDPSRSQRWIEGLNYQSISGLRNLAASFGLDIVLRKYSRGAAAAAELLDNQAFAHWKGAYDEWLEEKHFGDISKPRSAFRLLIMYWCEFPELIDPEKFFSTDSNKTFFGWCKKTRGKLTPHAVSTIRMIDAFSRWYAAKRPGLARIDDRNETLVLRRGYEWPLRQSDLDELSAVPNDRPSTSVQRCLPLEYLAELERILLEDDMAWPKTRRLDWITWKNPKTREYEKIYCPVLPYLVLLLIRLPIRSIQARRLDSGEGDSEWYDYTTDKWVKNYGRHAGYWERTNLRERRRGVLRRIEDPWNGTTLCGLFINSNKTRDRQYLYSEKSGYVISWHNAGIIDLVTKLRHWQEKYNPVTRPLPYKEVRAGVFPPSASSVLLSRPDAFYLFRYPGGQSGPFREHPPSGQIMRYFWFELLAELERRLAARIPNPPKLISRWIGSSPQASYFAVHGLRVGGLTRMAMAGVHPWILQNIAGHAGFVMTLYYLKPSPAHISEHLTEKYAEAMRNRQTEFAEFLSSSTLENVRHAIATRDGSNHAIDGLAAVRGVSGAASMMACLDHGICPNGRMRCDEGMLIHERTAAKSRELRDAFGPVPVTVGGMPDCTRCRFFISGTPFIDGLRIRTNEVSFAAHKSAQRQRELIRRLDDLEGARVEAQRRGEAVPHYGQIHRLRQELKAETDVLCDSAESLHAHGELFQKVRALLAGATENRDSRLPALLYSEAPEFRWGLRSEFEVLDELCHVARWFTSVRQEPLQRERRENVIRMLVRQNRPPVIALLNDDEANAAIDQLTSFLYRKMKRSTVQGLIDGETSFAELGIETEVDALLKTMVEAPLTRRIEDRSGLLAEL